LENELLQEHQKEGMDSAHQKNPESLRGPGIEESSQLETGNERKRDKHVKIEEPDDIEKRRKREKPLTAEEKILKKKEQGKFLFWLKLIFICI
jgi:hypothetical protein